MIKNYHFLLADDHALIRKGLTQIIKDDFAKVLISEAPDTPSVLKYLAVNQVDVLITDISMPGATGLELLKQVKDKYPTVAVLVLSMHAEEQYALRALRLGASGYLTKESAPEELIKALRHILAGKKYVSSTLASFMADHLDAGKAIELHETLSDRELEVLKRIAQGKSLIEIGGALNLSPNTISTYRTRLLDKMNMKTNAELIQYVLQNKLI